jgi:hypothetical protein
MKEVVMELTNISLALLPRYHRVAGDVMDRLPSGWHGDRIIRVEESRELLHLAPGRPAIACTARLQFKADEMWIITLYTARLDRLSDEAVRWILAREFGRLASDPAAWRRTTSLTAAPDDRAEAVALAWGFAEERHRFEQEYLLPKAS